MITNIFIKYSNFYRISPRRRPFPAGRRGRRWLYLWTCWGQSRRRWRHLAAGQIEAGEEKGEEEKGGDVEEEEKAKAGEKGRPVNQTRKEKLRPEEGKAVQVSVLWVPMLCLPQGDETWEDR